MAALNRKVGATSQLVPVYIPDATVSTGAGLANITASSVTYGFLRDNMALVSSGTCSSGGTLGTYSVSSLTQVDSTKALGWYQFGLPDIALLSGSSVALHFSGAPSMAPVPVLIDMAGHVLSVGNSVSVSTLSVPVGVSSASVNLGVSTLATSVSSVTGPVNVSSSAVLLGVSTLSVPVGVSSASVNLGVSTVAIQVGVSSYSRQVGVSSATVDFGVSTVGAASRQAIADSLLGRNVSSGGDGGRTVGEAFAVLRNKVDVTQGIVFATDDTTTLWSFTVSTSAVNPLVVLDPT